MITITLSFNSIEAARQALLDIPATALVGGPAPEASTPKVASAPAAASGRNTAKTDAAHGKTADAKTPVAEPVAAPSPPWTAATEGNAAAEPSEQEAPAASTASSSGPVDYATLQKAVFTLAGKSRETAAAVVASFGVKTFKDLPAEKWAAALAAVNAKLAKG